MQQCYNGSASLLNHKAETIMTPSFVKRSSRALTGLSKLGLAMAGALALLGSAPAAAAVIDFETQMPWIYNGGEVIEENGFSLRVVDNHGVGDGLAAGIVNGSDPTSCALGGCPSGNNSLFYVGVADGSAVITRNWVDPTFRLRGLDFSFMAPLGGLTAGSYGQLQLIGNLAGGGTISTALDFPSAVDALGNPMFATASLASAFMNATLTSLSIRACINDGTSCIYPDENSPFLNQAQFGIDNIDLAEVPEPGSLALIGLGMGAFALRRRKAAAATTATVTAA